MPLDDELNQFKQLFKQHINGAQKATLRWVSAIVVDWDDKTMTAEDSEGVPYYDVLLGVGMMVIKPKTGTDCLIAILEGDEATAFLLYANEADLIEFNGGNNGGLAITPTLIDELNKTNALLQAIINIINGAAISEPGNGSASALQTALKTAIINKKLGDYSQIENKQITH
jgi:hypothetical protein